MERLTIDRLAREAGMTVRNVRAHQTRGLLPPPDLEGRTGYYGAEHLARLRLVKDLQSAGFNLAAIKSLLDAAPRGTGEEVLAFERALMAPWGEERPMVMEPAELAAMFDEPPQGVVERAVELGLLRPLDDGRVEVPMPALLRAGRELRDIGVTHEQLLTTLAALLEHVRAIAGAFVDQFVAGVWRPFEERGQPAEEWPDIRRALERIRPMASEALSSAFHGTMKAAVEEAFGRELERRSAAGREAG